VQQCAAQILGERAAELAGAARRLGRVVPLAGVADDLDALAQRYEDLHLHFETDLGAAVDRVATLVVPRPVAPSPAPSSELPQASSADATVEVARAEGIELRFEGRRCIHSRHCVLEAPMVFLANTPGAWIHPEATTVEHCVRVAHSCPSGAITYERHDGGPQEAAPGVNVVRVRENGPYAIHAAIDCARQRELRATLCRCGQSRRKPYCDGSHTAAGFAATGEPATRLGAARGARRRAVDHARPQRSAAAGRQRRDLQRHRPHGAADAVGAAVPLRRVGNQAVLRRLACTGGVSVRRRLSEAPVTVPVPLGSRALLRDDAFRAGLRVPCWTARSLLDCAFPAGLRVPCWTARSLRADRGVGRLDFARRAAGDTGCRVLPAGRQLSE
jgi:uncharacterized Fe-S cluster protein YjdI/CDGSH-type Zn-finger protein